MCQSFYWVKKAADSGHRVLCRSVCCCDCTDCGNDFPSGGQFLLQPNLWLLFLTDMSIFRSLENLLMIYVEQRCISVTMCHAESCVCLLCTGYFSLTLVFKVVPPLRQHKRPCKAAPSSGRRRVLGTDPRNK